MEHSELWWKHTFGPAKLLHEAAETLLSGGHPWVNYPNMPWAAEFRDHVKQMVEEKNAGLSFEFMDLREEENLDPLRTLRSLDGEGMRYYMPSVALEKYIQQKNLFPNTVIWVYGYADGESEAWLKLSERCAKSKTAFRIVCEGTLPAPGSGRVRSLSGREYVSRFDSLLFIMSTVSERLDFSVEQRNYLSTLLNEMFTLNPEAANEAVSDLDGFLREPVALGLRYLPGCDEAEVSRAVWRAQVKAIFPLVEQQRLRIIERNLKGIRGILPFSDNYGNSYTRPEEIELRHLVHYTSTGQAFLSEADQKLLGILHPMRNKLAHLIVLEKEEVEQILTLS
jgi:hypothetical protein